MSQAEGNFVFVLFNLVFVFSQDWQEIVALYEADNVYLGKWVRKMCQFV